MCVYIIIWCAINYYLWTQNCKFINFSIFSILFLVILMLPLVVVHVRIYIHTRHNVFCVSVGVVTTSMMMDLGVLALNTTPISLAACTNASSSAKWNKYENYMYPSLLIIHVVRELHVECTATFFCLDNIHIQCTYVQCMVIQTTTCIHIYMYYTCTWRRSHICHLARVFIPFRNDGMA